MFLVVLSGVDDTTLAISSSDSSIGDSILATGDSVVLKVLPRRLNRLLRPLVTTEFMGVLGSSMEEKERLREAWNSDGSRGEGEGEDLVVIISFSREVVMSRINILKI